MIKETKSNWECVTNIIQQKTPVTLSASATQIFFQEPHKLLCLLNQYKFAAKLLKKGQRVLDLECGDGLGSYILAKHGLEVHGLTENKGEHDLALKNFDASNLAFSCGSITQAPLNSWDAIIALNSKQLLNQTTLFLTQMREKISPDGLIILRVPEGNSLYIQVSKYLREHFVYLWSFAIKNEGIQIDSHRISPQSPSILVCGIKKV